MKKGRMIVIDGANGGGKSTAIRSLASFLSERGYEVITTREPGGTSISEQIRELLLSIHPTRMEDMTELMLFAAARAQHYREMIKPALASGKIVISDRFDSATVSFQHYARGLPLDTIEQLNTMALEGFKPDMTIILDVTPEVGMQRVINRGEALERMETEENAFHARARHGYLEQARQNPDRFTVVDASRAQEHVIADVQDVALELLNGHFHREKKFEEGGMAP